jgi:phosphopantothenoylcysteine decarboxylase/phosphopantothenate--cysteine ligase
MLRGADLILGVTGSIAAFKAIEVLRLLTLDEGARVTTILTRHARRFVGPLSFSVLSGRPCLTDQFTAEEMRASFIPPDDPGRAPIVHIDLAHRAALVVVAPASANLIGKLAAGIADDLLTVTIMATTAPVLLAPAMHDNMWTNPIVQANVRRLTEVGFHFVGPVAGDLAFGKGPGRLADPAVIVAACREVAGKWSGPLSGKTVLVTAGRTEEPLDPVRALSNRSSGKMGFAVAAAARDLGARVVLVAGAASVPPPAGVQLVEASTAETMRARVLAELEHADALIMAAAVADYRPKVASPEKIRRQAKPLHIELEPTPDILAEAGKRKGGRILVGFALETGDNGVASAREKLIAKNLDLVVVNQADEAIGADTNRVMLVDGKGERPLPVLPKMEVAQVILAEVVQRMGNARLPGRRAAKGRK